MSEHTLVLWVIIGTSAMGGVFDPRAGWAWFLAMTAMYAILKAQQP